VSNPVLLTPLQALQYRALMLQAYADCPDAFTSSVAERAALPLAWWEQRLGGAPVTDERVWGVLAGHELAGVVGLQGTLVWHVCRCRISQAWAG